MCVFGDTSKGTQSFSSISPGPRQESIYTMGGGGDGRNIFSGSSRIWSCRLIFSLSDVVSHILIPVELAQPYGKKSLGSSLLFKGGRGVVSVV